MLSVFSQVERDGTVSANEFADLKTVTGNAWFFRTNDYVNVLANDIVLGNAANAHYQGAALGNLSAGSSAAQLDKLVHKWFLGDDHPTTMAGVTYQQTSGSLFPHTPTYTDVQQGMVGDCYLVSSLGEAALKNPGLITNMFIVNGDGTYTVRFYHNGAPDYVTVDSKLPVDARGNFVYADMGMSTHSASTPLWVALAEKAYAQMNESGWLRANLGDHGHNSYDAISSGNMTDALTHITNQHSAYSAVNASTFMAALNAGKLITFGTYSQPVDKAIVGGHAYAVLSYNPTTQMVYLFNPWGVSNPWAPGIVGLNWEQMKNDFFGMEYTV